jgi:diguanylate cyclase (GGDEF)-like protein
MLGRLIESRVVARAAVVGLAIGLVFLAALAFGVASTTSRATKQVRSQNDISDTWGQVDLHVGLEDETVYDYVRAGSDIGRTPLASVIGSADRSLDLLVRQGGTAEATQARLVQMTYASQSVTLHRLLEAGNQHDRAKVVLLAEQAQMGAAATRKQVAANVSRKRLEINDYLTSVDRTTDRLRTAAAATLGSTLLVFALCSTVLLGYQRRIERQAAESGYQARHDALTGLANRVLLADRLEQAVIARGRHGDTVGLLLLDLDRFKEVNDTLGHDYGDRLLQEVAKRLSDTVRTVDTVARLGGDEFAILLPRIGSAASATEAAGRLLAAIREPLSLDDVEIDIDGSIGVAVGEQDGPAGELLRRADVAMYAAKRARIGIAAYAPGLDDYNGGQLLARTATAGQPLTPGPAHPVIPAAR